MSQKFDGKTAPVEGIFINGFKNGEKIPGLGLREVLDPSNDFLWTRLFTKEWKTKVGLK